MSFLKKTVTVIRLSKKKKKNCISQSGQGIPLYLDDNIHSHGPHYIKVLLFRRLVDTDRM